MNSGKIDEWILQNLDNEAAPEFADNPDFDLIREYARQLNGEIDVPISTGEYKE
ncbi:hypothetical protein ACFQZT_09105 [Paenibacillus sp. GCM10027628]|uniref:hypothetical protein n=1 Tax=Paenibacillus sp. GCM10027628 TaxID=3273413 RepID=UPI00362E2703